MLIASYMQWEHGLLHDRQDVGPPVRDHGGGRAAVHR
jgi:hypothetical protein